MNNKEILEKAIQLYKEHLVQSEEAARTIRIAIGQLELELERLYPGEG